VLENYNVHLWDSVNAHTTLLYSLISLLPLQSFTRCLAVHRHSRTSAYLYLASTTSLHIATTSTTKKNCSCRISKMGLLNLSDPLLLNVFRLLDDPKSPDLCNVTLVCKRFNLLTTPLIYREVTMTPDWPVIMPGADVPPPLRNLIDTINHDPAKGLFFESASFAWNDMTPNWWTCTFELLAKFRSVRTLYLRAGPTFVLFYDHMPRFLNSLYFSNYLDQVSFPDLHTLTIEDCKLTMKDILKVYTFPSLEHLQINRFNPKISEALALPATGKYPPTKITKLGFSWSPTPMGLYVETLLKNHPKLEEFSWILDTGVAPIPEAPESAITTTFVHFQSTIRKIYLSIVEPNSMSPGSSRIQMNFSTFTSLRNLIVHDRWIFPPPTGNGRVFGRSQLGAKLPHSLESLTVCVPLCLFPNQTH
jgi:F-box-like